MLFEPSSNPRLFGIPPGVDFGRALVEGLLDRSKEMASQDFARVQIFVNTRRMERRIKELFDKGPARLLPKIRIVTDLGNDPAALDIPPAVAPLRRRLELSQLVDQLLIRDPSIAPRSALFDLSDGLARLMDEMNGEGVGPDAFDLIQTGDLSEHWARALEFLRIAKQFLEHGSDAPDRETRQRLVIEALVEKWQAEPPAHPVIVAGSTGSRGATSLFMKSVAGLPQGAVILPGFDFDLPDAVWDSMQDAMTAEDHPQFRFKRLMQDLDLVPDQIRKWTNDEPASPMRNKVISLSLRPAPVTDQWRSDGPKLSDLERAMSGLTLVEAPDPRTEAETIALGLRSAIEAGKTAALITPDRTLSRQVAAALDRWNIVPDDSAGQPLALSPPGRFLRQVGQLFGDRMDGAMLLALLKHPLTHSGLPRGQHLRRTNELELHLRRKGPAFPDRATLTKWATDTAGTDEGRTEWAEWVSDLTEGLSDIPIRHLSEHVADHIALAEKWAAGPKTDGAGELWDQSAGREALRVMTDLRLNADAGGMLGATDYLALFNAVLSGGEVRNPDAGHPQVLFWGTLEARVQGADLVILAGLNDGVWPETPAPDPWLNRKMRKDMGLLLPERRIGLSAHDYQQAVAGREVWITRAIRSDEAETVASRWVFRLTNLLAGLPDQGGERALDQVRARGQAMIGQAMAIHTLTRTIPKAKRPSPRPPVAARPKTLSVTQIERLIRDPYSIYAEKILGLRELDPLVPEPNGALRGNIIHAILEKFIREDHDPTLPETRSRLIDVAVDQLQQDCPWPLMQRVWLARFDQIADAFLADEADRRTYGAPARYETWGEARLDRHDFTLKAKADRIDLTPDNQAILYDYKTGKIPSDDEQRTFALQLSLEAAMVLKNGFKEIATNQVARCAYIGVGNEATTKWANLDKSPPAEVWERLDDLISAWSKPERGYSAHLAVHSIKDVGRYGHLSRFTEWNISDDVVPEDLT